MSWISYISIAFVVRKLDVDMVRKLLIRGRYFLYVFDDWLSETSIRIRVFLLQCLLLLDRLLAYYLSPIFASSTQVHLLHAAFFNLLARHA